jgi:ferredoxin
MPNTIPDQAPGRIATGECRETNNLNPIARWAVRLQPANLPFEASADVPLVLAAEKAGIEMPSSCRNGTCRTCLCELLAGSVTYVVDWPGLSAEEKAGGFILPCVALAKSDLTILQPHARAVFDD